MNTDPNAPTPETDTKTFIAGDFPHSKVVLARDYAELERQRDELSRRLNNPVRCHSGHERLPLALWDCPDCVDKIRGNMADCRQALTTIHETSASWRIRKLAADTLKATSPTIPQ
jgi:hypothetical protein